MSDQGQGHSTLVQAGKLIFSMCVHLIPIPSFKKCQLGVTSVIKMWFLQIFDFQKENMKSGNSSHYLKGIYIDFTNEMLHALSFNGYH